MNKAFRLEQLNDTESLEFRYDAGGQDTGVTNCEEFSAHEVQVIG